MHHANHKSKLIKTSLCIASIINSHSQKLAKAGPLALVIELNIN